MESTTVDISNKKSVENFIQTLEETLATSEIKVSMDLDGNINFKRIDGGEIILQEFTSATGRHGSWKPSPGQGDTISLSGTGIVDVMKSYTSNTLQQTLSKVKNQLYLIFLLKAPIHLFLIYQSKLKVIHNRQ